MEGSRRKAFKRKAMFTPDRTANGFKKAEDTTPMDMWTTCPASYPTYPQAPQQTRYLYGLKKEKCVTTGLRPQARNQVFF